MAKTEAYYTTSYAKSALRRKVPVSDLHGLHTPAQVTLISDTGVQCQQVFGGGGKGAAVSFADLGNGDHLIRPRTQLGGQRDGIAEIQGVDLAEVAVGASIVVE